MNSFLLVVELFMPAKKLKISIWKSDFNILLPFVKKK